MSRAATTTHGLPAEDVLPKTYKPAEHEDRIRARWERHNDGKGAFWADPSRVDRTAKPTHEPGAPRPPYSIVIPPPNVTGALHLGHALNNTLQDVLVRAYRMKGYETLWAPGADHGGIGTETVVERILRQRDGLRRKDRQREEFVAKVQQWKDEYEATIRKQLQLMGCSCDYERWRFTMDEVCAKAVREAFFQLFKEGLIYRGKRLVNWDPASQTALADDEVEMEEIDGQFYYLRYPLVAPSQDSRLKTQDPPASQASGLRPQALTWGELTKHNYPGASEHASDEQAFVTVATTRPETYLGDTAVGVNPKDPRWPALKAAGAHAQLPFVGRIVPIIADDYVVLPAPDPDAPGVDPKAKYATGFLKVTPAHDTNDYDLGIRHELDMINVMAPDASISDKHGWTDTGDAKRFVGLSREEARKAIVKAFKEAGLLKATKPYRHGVGHSYRTHVAIEPYLSDQWYAKVTDDRLRGSAQRAVAVDQRSSDTFMPIKGRPGDGEMEFYPARYAKMYESWHDNIRDWCISRQLWWGHRIPVWTVFLNEATAKSPVETHEQARRRHRGEQEERLRGLAAKCGVSDALTWRPGEPVEGRIPLYVCARNERAALALEGLAKIAKLAQTSDSSLIRKYKQERDDFQRHFGESALNAAATLRIDLTHCEQDPDVLDTWFSSAAWPLSTMGWPEPDAQPETRGLLEAFNPTSVLSTAREIITLWVSRMVMFNRFLTRDDSDPARRERIPFEDVYIHMVVQDGEGRRMSKSAGNGVDPLDIIATHGADAMRFTLCHMATQTQDVRMPVEVDPATGRNTSPKFDIGKRFANKLWNAARFTMMMLTEAAADGGPALRAGSEAEKPGPDSESRATRLIDRWMLSRLRASVEQIESALKNYEFSVYAQSLYDLLWRDFCDWYLEGIKPTLKQSPAQQVVLRATLDAILRLLHPVCPFVTEAIHERLRTLPSTGGGGGRGGGTALRAESGVPGVSLPDSELLCLAPWPSLDQSLRDEAAEREFDRMRALIEAIRAVREQQKVRPQRRITLHTDSATARAIAGAGGIVETLAGLERISAERPPPGVSTFTFEGREHALSNLMDAAQADAAAQSERDRLRKQVADLEASISVIEKRLANPGYAQKAPPHLVRQSRDQMESLRAEQAAARASLERLS